MTADLKENFFWSNKTGKILTLVFIVAIISSIAGGHFIYKKELAKVQNTQDIAATPTPTPVATIPLNKYSIRVLNGSGISGEAVKIKNILTSYGYNIVEIGNAPQNSNETSIQTKENIDETFLSDLKNKMATYSANIKTEILQNSENVDIQIILGAIK